VRAWILYSALRIGIFLALFALLYAITASVGVDLAWLISAVAAALLALLVSYIFLRPLRERVANEVVAARAGTGRPDRPSAGSDEEAEDSEA
jgi:hypothetical protein